MSMRSPAAAAFYTAKFGADKVSTPAFSEPHGSSYTRTSATSPLPQAWNAPSARQRAETKMLENRAARDKAIASKPHGTNREPPSQHVPHGQSGHSGTGSGDTRQRNADGTYA
jgi:hypothetical protein